MNKNQVSMYRCRDCGALSTVLCRPGYYMHCPVCGSRSLSLCVHAGAGAGDRFNRPGPPVKETISYDGYREYLLAFLREADEDLKEKRARFASFLHMDQADLESDPEFVRFLVSTTDELLDRAARLNTIAKTMAFAGTAGSA